MKANIAGNTYSHPAEAANTCRPMPFEAPRVRTDSRATDYRAVPTCRRIRWWIACCLLAAAAQVRPQLPAFNTPDLITYQGLLVDQNGLALAPTTPHNYTIAFRIFDAPSGGALLWAEEQIVTVDKGHFSVVLGQGTELSGQPRPSLAAVFAGPGASDRYLETTVTLSGNPVTITPRIRFLPAPYSLLSRNAVNLVGLAGTNTVVAATYDGGVIRLNVPLAGSGAQLTSLNADQLTSGTIPEGRLPAYLARRDQVNVFERNMQVDGHLRVGNVHSGSLGSPGWGSALVFSGAPRLGGAWSSDNSDPLWIARYNHALNESKLVVVIGDDPGLPQDMLVVGTYSGAGADFSQVGGTFTPMFCVRSDYRVGINTDAPSAPLTVRHDTDTRMRLERSDGRYAEMLHSGNSLVLRLTFSAHYPSNAPRSAIYDGDTNWDFASDGALKKDIVEAEPVLDRLLQVPVRRYRWKTDPADARRSLGVVAQEVRPLFPELVGTYQDPETGERVLTVAYTDFGLLAVKALQELKAAHDRELAALREELAVQRRRAEQLELELGRLTALERELARLREQLESTVGGPNPGALWAAREAGDRGIAPGTKRAPAD